MLVHDGRTARGREILGLEGSAIDVLQDIVDIVMEVRGVRVGTVGVDELGLQVVGVAGGGDDPHERDTAGVDAGAAAQDQVAVLQDIPVEAEARGDVRTGDRHVSRAGAGQGVAAGGELEVFLVGVVRDDWIDRELETDTGGHLEVVTERDLILGIPGVLHVLEGRVDLGEVVTVGVGDREGDRLAGGLEALPAVIDIVAETALHEAVLGVVVLELQAEHPVVDAVDPRQFVGTDDGLDVAEVAVGERVRTERGQDGTVALAIRIDIVLKDINRREVGTHEGTGLVLVGPGHAEHVVGAADTGVELSGDGGEVLLLEVAAGLEVHRIVGGTAVGVTVVRVRVDRVDRAGRAVGVGRMGVAETDVQLVGVVDDPVQAGHHFVVRSREGITLVAAGVITIGVGQVVLDLFHKGLGRTDGCAANSEVRIDAAGSRADNLTGTRNGIPGVFTVHEEEEFVLDDRTTQGEAEGVVQHVGLGDVLILNLVATHILAGVVIVDRSLDLVGTALGHGVDRTAGEAGHTDIERGDVDAHLLDRVKGDRAAAGREVGTDTEGVVERGTVDGHIGGTVVTATDGQTVGGR